MSREEHVSMEHSGQLPVVQSPDKREEEALIHSRLRSFMADQEKELKKSTDDMDTYNHMRDENEKLVNKLQQRMKDQDAFIQHLLRSMVIQNQQGLEECKKYLDQQRSTPGLRLQQQQQTLSRHTSPPWAESTSTNSGQPSPSADPGTNIFAKTFRHLTGFFSQRSGQHCEEKDLRISELEDKLEEKSRALEKTDKELKSLKDRLAARMNQMPKPENVENMNSPVNTDGLNKLYDKLRFDAAQRPDRALKKETIKEAFEKAEAAVAKLKKPINEMYGVKTSPPQVEKFRQTALENLQLALYHSSKQDVFKAAFPHFPGASAELPLASECCWLGCLMALHAPPLRPHWDKKTFTDKNPWPVFK